MLPAMKILSSLGLIVLLFPWIAAADIPPPPDYVETCTVKLQCAPEEVGVSCSTYFGEADKCTKLYSGKGFTHKCRTHGASTWTEVWCAPKGTPLPSPIPVKETTPPPAK